MMKTRRFLFCGFLALCSTLCGWAKTEVAGVYYEVTAETSTARVVTGGYAYYKGDVTIPGEVSIEGKTYAVTAIDNYAFYGCSDMTSIVLPNGLTSVGEGAFQGCAGLRAVALPGTVAKVGRYAFQACTGLAKMDLPDGLATLEDAVFRECTGLASVSVPKSLAKLGDNIFYACTSLSTITVHADNAVYDSREGCNAIIETASHTLKQGCNGTVIPGSVTTIDYNAFSGLTGLTDMAIPSSVTVIRGSAFRYCSALTQVELSDNVKEIGSMAFANCTGLKQIVLPASLAVIEDATFQNCTGLQSVTIPASVTNIENYAFDKCAALAHVYCLATVPPSTYYGSFGIYTAALHVPVGCRAAYASAANWMYFGSIDEYDPHAAPMAYAEYDAASTTLTFRYGTFTPDGSTSWEVGNTSFTSPAAVSWYDYAASITRVVFDASFQAARPLNTALWFYGCKNLTTLEGLENLNTEEVTNMRAMFDNCSSLMSLDLSHFNTSKVTNMRLMFAFCDRLETVNLRSFNTENVTDMYGLFANDLCLGTLDGLDLSSFNTQNVTDMGFMFFYCDALESLDLSNFDTRNVNDMTQMFAACPRLVTIYCDDTWTATSSAYMFYGCDNLRGAIGYDEAKVDVTYANPVTGYFTKKDPEGIRAVSAGEAGNAPWYDLNGRRLPGAPAQQGIYIRGGRKVWVR